MVVTVNNTIIIKKEISLKQPPCNHTMRQRHLDNDDDKNR